MAEQKIISKEHVYEDGVVVIKETIEKKFSIDELQKEISQYRTQQQGILRQVDTLKAQYNFLKSAAAEVQKILDAVESLNVD
ncbi:hypothetical protein PAEVO_51790 [Paenibacillus sp. GM2FR]|uniref:hypothetical protein n=1 Tax=Paenibacillus sp. GM2FR TaxID=2059268 RepID=UPI000C2746AB|nr:hypothetical protein [Paenibacillus sp. GM2FR]PJN50135.1 hypothetical protein PAEVO_51790 [Paenibacillus sp. GM2FR]